MSGPLSGGTAALHGPTVIGPAREGAATPTFGSELARTAYEGENSRLLENKRGAAVTAGL